MTLNLTTGVQKFHVSKYPNLEDKGNKPDGRTILPLVNNTPKKSDPTKIFTSASCVGEINLRNSNSSC